MGWRRPLVIAAVLDIAAVISVDHPGGSRALWLVAAVVVYALIARGSAIAWKVQRAVAVAGLLLFLLAGIVDRSMWIPVALYAAQLWLLTAPSLRVHVGVERLRVPTPVA